MHSSEELEGWNLLRKWDIAASTIWLSFDGIGNAISFAAFGTLKLSPDEKRLDLEGKGCNVSLDLVDVHLAKVVSDKLLSTIGHLGTLPESLQVCLHSGDRCTLAVRSVVPS